MKNQLYVLLSVIAGFAHANDTIKVDRKAALIHVKSLSVTVLGRGEPITKVTVQAVFFNACTVPKPDEMVVVTQMSQDYRELTLTLADIGFRVCPSEYAPVTKTLDLGTYSVPVDGLFSKITVNGKVYER